MDGHLEVCALNYINTSIAPDSQLKVKILRNVKASFHPFTDYFKGFEKVDAVRSIFGERTEKVLQELKVEFVRGRGYMFVSGEDGHIKISTYYMKNGDRLDIYLDIIHELVHVKQFMEGKKLFDKNFTYVDRPTEIEAHRHAVKEARNLGMDDKRILEYLKTEWISDEELNRLAKTLNVKTESSL